MFCSNLLILKQVLIFKATVLSDLGSLAKANMVCADDVTTPPYVCYNVKRDTFEFIEVYNNSNKYQIFKCNEHIMNAQIDLIEIR